MIETRYLAICSHPECSQWTAETTSERETQEIATEEDWVFAGCVCYCPRHAGHAILESVKIEDFEFVPAKVWKNSLVEWRTVENYPAYKGDPYPRPKKIEVRCSSVRNNKTGVWSDRITIPAKHSDLRLDRKTAKDLRAASIRLWGMR